MHLTENSMPLPKAAQDVLMERMRQQHVEGFSSQHDRQYRNGELAQAAACYALNAVHRRGYVPVQTMLQQVVFSFGQLWPWSMQWWKPKSRRRDLVRAAALLIAEIELGDSQHPPGADW